MTAFTERQRFRQWWFVLLMLLPVVLLWGGFVYQIVLGETFGDQPAPDWLLILLWVLFGTLFPAFMLSLTLVTTVDESGVGVRFWPLPVKALYLHEDIDRHEALEYRPIREFGGWGIRWRGKRKRVWSVSGKEAVRLYLLDGREVTIGSLYAEDFDGAMSQSSRRGRGR